MDYSPSQVWLNSIWQAQFAALFSRWNTRTSAPTNLCEVVVLVKYLLYFHTLQAIDIVHDSRAMSAPSPTMSLHWRRTFLWWVFNVCVSIKLMTLTASSIPSHTFLGSYTETSQHMSSASCDRWLIGIGSRIDRQGTFPIFLSSFWLLCNAQLCMVPSLVKKLAHLI